MQKSKVVMGLFILATVLISFQNCSQVHSIKNIDYSTASGQSNLSQLPATGTDGGKNSSDPEIPSQPTQENSGACVAKVVVTGDASTTQGPMGSKVVYSLELANTTIKSSAQRIQVVSATGPQSATPWLHPSELNQLSQIKMWSSMTGSLVVQQTIQTQLDPAFTAPGAYTRAFELFDASGKKLCTTNSVQFVINLDSLPQKDFSQIVQSSRYNSSVLAGSEVTCEILTSQGVESMRSTVDSLADAYNKWNACKQSCRESIQRDVKKFTESRPMNVDLRNGCEFSSPLWITHQGQSRYLVIKERILTVQSKDVLKQLSLTTTDSQKNYARFQWPLWQSLTIYQILAGINTNERIMIVDTHSVDATTLETLKESVIE